MTVKNIVKIENLFYLDPKILAIKIVGWYFT